MPCPGAGTLGSWLPHRFGRPIIKHCSSPTNTTKKYRGGLRPECNKINNLLNHRGSFCAKFDGLLDRIRSFCAKFDGLDDRQKRCMRCLFTMVVNHQFKISDLLNSVLCPVGSARVSLRAPSASEPEYRRSLSYIQSLHSPFSPLSVGSPAEDRSFASPLLGGDNGPLPT